MLTNYVKRSIIHALEFARRRDPNVLWVPDSARFGNILYYWMRTASRRLAGNNTVMLRTNHTQLLSESFPTFDKMTISRRELSFFSKREFDTHVQEYGKSFTQSDLDVFIRDHLWHQSSPLPALTGRIQPSDLTINVRRGDYYSVPRWRGDYSFDIVEYVRTAVNLVQLQSTVRSISIVSDDIDWCRLKLGWLTSMATVQYPSQGRGALHDLATLAASRRLVLANSTFSYWGGYLATWRSETFNGEEPVQVWAPWFHSRRIDNGRANQLDPRWNVIETIPGGWDG